MVVAFNKACATTSRKYVSKSEMSIPNLSDKLNFFWSHSSVLALEKWPKYLNFQSFFSSKRYFGSYFQWNACTHFHKICSWARYNNAKFIRHSNLSGRTSPFLLWKNSFKNIKFSIIFSLKELLVDTFSETCALTSRKYVSELGIDIPNLLEKLKYFLSHSSVLPKDLNFYSFFTCWWLLSMKWVHQ